MSVGSVTGFMKASGHLVMIPEYNLTPICDEALYACAITAIGPGLDVDPVTISIQYFRPPRPQSGNFLGRARILNASSRFISCAVDIEDPVGRLVGSAISHWAIRTVDPPPPSPPASIELIEESTYSTPDPPERAPVGALPPADLQRRLGGLELARMVMSGELPTLPLMNTLGARWLSVDEGASRVTMPASEWFCSSSRNLAAGAIESFLNVASTIASVTVYGPGQAEAYLEGNTRFLRPVAADGRQLTATGKVTRRVGNLVLVDSEAIDADGNTVAVQSGIQAVLAPRDRSPSEPERILATLLFTDIVGSTQHAQRLGDATWRSLLEEHHALVRRELADHRGREVKTIGDGFLARFDSPVSAIRCASAIRDGVRRLQLEVRAGVHIGECEVQGSDLAGIAVHVAARIVAAADPAEILVSQTVRDLTAGSGIRFASRGAHALKGVEGEWNLHAVDES
ncbi:MAG TPA: adenylate/guanylate cyclase domain-containing protein [Nocardioidaceae bacterium]|nr:adenylate/guanylate cyclase domain-containing protein [Nocardioidaceae bacterium]